MIWYLNNMMDVLAVLSSLVFFVQEWFNDFCQLSKNTFLCLFFSLDPFNPR